LDAGAGVAFVGISGKRPEFAWGEIDLKHFNNFVLTGSKYAEKLRVFTRDVFDSFDAALCCRR
jgi:hypothetical protein